MPNLVHKLYLNTDPLWMSTPASFAAVTGSLVGESFPRSHLIVRHLGMSHSNDPNGSIGLPFISLGAQDNRGNNTVVGAMNSATRPHTVKFKARIWDIRDPDPDPNNADGGLWFYMYAISEWGGKQRGVFLNLKHIGDNTDWSTSLFSGMSNRWNWPIQESFFHPGVDWAYIDTEDMWSYSVPIPATACGIHPSKTPQMTSTGVDYQFEVDLRELFRCTSTRGLFQSVMPKTTVLPILGVHWGVEMNGVDGYIWASVHDMKMQ